MLFKANFNPCDLARKIKNFNSVRGVINILAKLSKIHWGRKKESIRPVKKNIIKKIDMNPFFLWWVFAAINVGFLRYRLTSGLAKLNCCLRYPLIVLRK
jgi:hypothetical protein